MSRAGSVHAIAASSADSTNGRCFTGNRRTNGRNATITNQPKTNKVPSVHTQLAAWLDKYANGIATIAENGG